MSQKAEVIFRQAVAYMAGAMAVRRVFRPLEKTEDFESLPYLLNVSFGIELLLKALIGLEKVIPRSHKYVALFNELSGSKRIKVLHNYRRSRNMPELTEQTFLGELQNFENTFVDWRYIYEADSGYTRLDINGLVAFANSLLEVAKSTRDDWQGYAALIDRAKNE